MYRIVGAFYAVPGKIFELIALLHEAKTLAKKINGTEAVITRPIAGLVSEVLYVFQVETLAEYEEGIKKIESNDEYKKLFAKFAPVVVPNTSRWQIYRDA